MYYSALRNLLKGNFHSQNPSHTTVKGNCGTGVAPHDALRVSGFGTRTLSGRTQPPNAPRRGLCGVLVTPCFNELPWGFPHDGTGPTYSSLLDLIGVQPLWRNLQATWNFSPCRAHGFTEFILGDIGCRCHLMYRALKLL